MDGTKLTSLTYDRGSFGLRAAMSLSRLWQRQGKRAAARQAFTEIYRSLSEGADTADVREAEALLHALA